MNIKQKEEYLDKIMISLNQLQSSLLDFYEDKEIKKEILVSISKLKILYLAVKELDGSKQREVI